MKVTMKLFGLFCCLFLLLCSCSNDSNNIDIPDDAIEFNGHMYKYYLETIDWHSAKEECENYGGHLATISSEEENQFLINNRPDELFSFYWIGATDEIEEGVWKWVNGEAFLYTNWSEDSPNNDLDREHYAGIMSYEENFDDFSTPIGSWNDFPIITRYRSGYICEWEESKVKDKQTIIKGLELNESTLFSFSANASILGGITFFGGLIAIICNWIRKVFKKDE